MAANATEPSNKNYNYLQCNSKRIHSTTLNTTASLSATYIEFSATADAANVLNVNSVSFFRQASNLSKPNGSVTVLTVCYIYNLGAAPNSSPSGTVAAGISLILQRQLLEQ
jgi:hypothetical protein